MSRHPLRSPAVSTSLDSIQILPRTPRSARMDGAGRADDDDEVELSLLGEEERRADGFGEVEEARGEKEKKSISGEDKRAMVLLSVLYLIQGRRKSWIIPMQMLIGSLMLWMSFNAEELMEHASEHVYQLTFVFTTLVLIAATQDIAVDGTLPFIYCWALTLLSEENLSYASTCQTIGLNTGYFASFTVFLALNSEAFAVRSEKWGIPRLMLGTYLRFWSVICFSVTIWLLFFQKERKEALNEEDMSIVGVYKTIWSIMKLKHVQSLLFMYLFAKIGFAAYDAAFSLKIVERGLGKEDLAIAVLIDFPFQIFGGWLAARYSTGDKPLRPWLWAFWPRLGFGAVGLAIIHWFPHPPVSRGFFVFVVVHTVLASFSSTIQFVGISAFHTRISDPLIGGTYMTLLNTFTNLGGTWPKFFVLKGIDLFTVANCETPVDEGTSLTKAVLECVSDQGKVACKDLGGTCVVERDGFFITSGLCMFLGVTFLAVYIWPTARRLQSLPTSKWRVYT
ncbi:MFS general substrate transporter [Amylostereum chailletii]|nr:MFS general substrate transporter [Amylostereum chailletii]